MKSDAVRVETTLRTTGWHQHATFWRKSRGSPDAQCFHSACLTDRVGEGVIYEVTWLQTPRMQSTADWPHSLITCLKLSIVILLCKNPSPLHWLIQKPFMLILMSENTNLPTNLFHTPIQLLNNTNTLSYGSSVHLDMLTRSWWSAEV